MQLHDHAPGRTSAGFLMRVVQGSEHSLSLFASNWSDARLPSIILACPQRSDYWQQTLVLRQNQTVSDHNQIILARFFRFQLEREMRFLCVSPIKKTTYDFLVSGLIVEAAGVEPASRDVSAQTSTCVSGQFESHRRVPGRQGSSSTSQELF